ncbi:MAG: hypothetical protein JOY99_13530 [Sphingomonadaceae bacterium]|nr:hypothetical protein [Sphingomonadaceae bacterium]
MNRSRLFTHGLCAAALAALTAAPALAEGKGDRAQKAIAAAQAKIDSINVAGLTGDAPGLQARAKAALAHAREDVSAGDKEAGIRDAISASQLADQAIAAGQRNRDMATQAHLEDAHAAVNAAQDQAADASARADSAQAQAADANARADAAQQAAASAQADAAAARAAPPATTTTVTTVDKTHTSSAAPVHHKAVHTSASGHSSSERTTTTVTTAQAGAAQ